LGAEEIFIDRADLLFQMPPDFFKLHLADKNQMWKSL
jgi:hypothetical protein